MCVLHVRQRVADHCPPWNARTATRLTPRRELENLQRLGNSSSFDVVGEHLLGANRGIDGKVLRRENLGMGEVITGAYASDLGRNVEHRRGQLARDHVGLVALGDREDEIRIARAGLLENRGMGGVADEGSQIEPVLEGLQAVWGDVDHRDVVGFGNEIFRNRRSDLPRAEDDYFHESLAF